MSECSKQDDLKCSSNSEVHEKRNLTSRKYGQFSIFPYQVGCWWFPCWGLSLCPAEGFMAQLQVVREWGGGGRGGGVMITERWRG
jgi:hypothetical protein